MAATLELFWEGPFPFPSPLLPDGETHLGWQPVCKSEAAADISADMSAARLGKWSESEVVGTVN